MNKLIKIIPLIFSGIFFLFSCRAIFPVTNGLSLPEMNDSDVISAFSASDNLSSSEFYRLGIAYHNMSQTDLAVTSFCYSAFSKRRPLSGIFEYFKNRTSHSAYYDAALSRIIEILHSRQEYASAAELFQFLSRKDPALYFSSCLTAANCYVSIQDFNTAEKLLVSLEGISSKNEDYEKLRKIRLAGIYEKAGRNVKAFWLYYSIIRSGKISWQGNIAARRLYGLIENNDVKFRESEGYIIANYLTEAGMFEESQNIVSELFGVKFRILQIRNFCGIKNITEAENLLKYELPGSSELKKEYAQDLWKYSSKAAAVKLYEDQELYSDSAEILRNLAEYYYEKKPEKATEYLQILAENFKTDSTNERYFWMTGKQFIENSMPQKALDILNMQLSLYPDGTYAGNALYWRQKLDKNISSEKTLRQIFFSRPDSVYLYLLFDKTRNNFTENECLLNFRNAAEQNDSESMLFNNFLLFSIGRDKAELDDRIALLDKMQINPYSEFTGFLESNSYSANFRKYSSIFDVYFNAGDFSKSTALEKYLSYDLSFEIQTAKKMYFLYSAKNFHFQKFMYISRLMKLFGLKENLSVSTQQVRESLYPLAYMDIITQKSREHNLDPFLVLSIIRAESAYKTDAVSSSNAKGLMQIMDTTAKDMARKSGLKKYDIFSPDDNISFGSGYFRWLNGYFENNLIRSLGAYNAGPGNMKKWIRKFETDDEDMFIEKIPFIETRNYILKILKYRSVYEKIY